MATRDVVRRARKVARIHQLKVTLLWVRPPIWRRIQVSSGTTLGELHWILQVVMGWDNSHLHQFLIRRMYYADPEFETEAEDENRFTLDQVAPRARMKFEYQYDFGDGWQHEVLVEKVLPREPGVRYPVCLDGERACPPEDCGGIGGYQHLLEAIRNPKRREHKAMLEWIEGSFNSEAFDMKRVNRGLGNLGRATIDD